MKRTVLATYERKSTLWKNANGFYHATNWTKMECVVADYSEEIKEIKEMGMRWVDSNNNDVTERQIERIYGRPYIIKLTNARETNVRCFSFITKDEANQFFKEMLHHKVLSGWHKVQ